MRTLKNWQGGIIFVINLLLTLMLLSCGEDDGGSASNDISSEIAELPVVTETQLEGGYVWITQIAELSQEDLLSLGSEPLKLAQQYGWIRTERGLELNMKMNPLMAWELMNIEFIFEINGQEIPIANDGSIELSSDMDNTAPAKLFSVFGEQKEEFMSPTVDINLFIDAQGLTGVEIAWRRFVSESSADHHNATAALPCLDYNGLWSNGVNEAGGWQEYKNFLYSDCFWSIAIYWYNYCWYDHAYAYCNGTTRNCSGLIGHCSSYHKHTSATGPSC